ncbi:OmpA family protein [Reichenbachiella faecimaris]|uniref:OmpA family protein n=1 Tax=Reichenbachiella faecimaris TaxID=692418 RepID=A0A1W2GDC7_REIFA|nr:OmpA family protein [Reichenbachiella faecimaris]SMD34276.1 OmpA family protein [Reichenbachiella faecimaris]
MKITGFLFSLCFFISNLLLLSHQNALAQAHEEGTLIRVTGTVLDNESKSPLIANVFYEKLPYYDDMGIAATNQQNGVYELYMLANLKYIINVKADGFKTISEEIEIVDNGTQLIEKNFIMEPDAAHEKFDLHNLIFARGRAVIDESSYAELNDFVLWLDQRPTVNIQLEGHTDFQGNADANLQLSQQRVDAVKDYLVKKGVKKARILTKAFGGTQPLSRERTDEARTANRRVEVRILKQ